MRTTRPISAPWVSFACLLTVLANTAVEAGPARFAVLGVAITIFLVQLVRAGIIRRPARRP